MAPSFGNLFLGIFGTNALSNALFHPRTWCTEYLDDIFMIRTEELDQMETFVDYLNNNSTIRFASNHSINNVPFLDVIKLRVISISLSLSSETRKKPVRKKKWSLDILGGGSRAAISFSPGFLSRFPRRTKRKRDLARDYSYT